MLDFVVSVTNLDIGVGEVQQLELWQKGQSGHAGVQGRADAEHQGLQDRGPCQSSAQHQAVELGAECGIQRQ